MPEPGYIKKKQSLIENGFDAYCLFTMSGKEKLLADKFNQKYEDAIALTLKSDAHQSRNGIKSVVKKIILPGYVFLFIPKDGKSEDYLIQEGLHFNVLDKKTEHGKLADEDYEYAKWVIEIDGYIEISQAIKIDDKVKIVSGPLKGMEGKIKKYSKKNRNCLVETSFMDRNLEMWLPFEWIDLSK